MRLGVSHCQGNATILRLVLCTLLILGSLSPSSSAEAAATATVTVTSTSRGTLQTQLSTNNVWAHVVNDAPSGQAKLNALNAPYIRLHIGDDGGAPAMPQIRAGQWANVGESRPFENLDSLVGNVFAAGQVPVMNVKFAPDFMWSCYPNSVGVSPNGTQGTGTVTDLTFAQYAAYMARLVAYYNKGVMTTEAGVVITNPSGTSRKIVWWELWNEPDLGNETPCAPSSGVGLTYQQYATMWNAVTAAMLAVDPALKFVGPATAGSQFGSSNATGNQYVDYLMANAVVRPSAPSFHGYGYWDNTVSDAWIFDGDNSEPAAQCCGGIVDLVNGVKRIRQTYPDLPVWITEVNVNADWGADTRKRPSSEFSAAWWGAMFAAVAPEGAGIIHQYDLADGPQFGLFDDSADKTYLAYYVFQLLNLAFPQGSTLLTSTSTDPGIVSLAARRPDGAISVMVVNRQLASSSVLSTCGAGGVSTAVTVNLQGLSVASGTLRQVDRTSVNCSTNAASAPTSTILNLAQPIVASFPGYGLAVVTLMPGGSPVSLSVSKAGSGVGTVTGPQIACGTACQTQLPRGMVVTLTASPDLSTNASRFAGWSGACTGTGTCQVTLNSATSVTATFERVTVGVSVTRPAGASSGGDPTLQASLTARAGCGAIQQVQFGVVGASFSNARLSVLSPAAGPTGRTTGFRYTPPAGTTAVTVSLQRVTQSGGATISPVVLTDGCGQWQTFFGGGPAAFR